MCSVRCLQRVLGGGSTEMAGLGFEGVKAKEDVVWTSGKLTHGSQPPAILGNGFTPVLQPG